MAKRRKIERFEDVESIEDLKSYHMYMAKEGNATITGNPAFDRDYINAFSDLCTEYWLKMTTAIKWEGLPEEIPYDQPEKLLNEKGYFIAFIYEGVKYILTGCQEGNLDEYDNLTEIHPIGANGFNFDGKSFNLSPYPQIVDGKPVIKPVEAVIVKNNDLMMPTIAFIRNGLMRAAFIKATIMEQVRASKFHGYIKAPNATAGKNAQTAIKGITGLILPVVDTVDGVKDQTLKDILEVIELTKGATIQELQQLYDNEIADIEERLGIKTMAILKKERVVNQETHANDETTALNYEAGYNPRQIGAERMNKYLGFNVHPKSIYDKYVEEMNEIEDDTNLQPNAKDGQDEATE